MNTLWDEKRLNQKIDRINNDLQTEPFNKSDIAYLEFLIKVETSVLNNLIRKLHSEREVEIEIKKKLKELNKKILKKQNLVFRYMNALSVAKKH